MTMRATVHSFLPSSLRWVDSYIKKVKPYIFVRLEDNLLIKRPNQVMRLNSTAAQILYSLLNGRPLTRILGPVRSNHQKMEQVAAFMSAVKQYLDGVLCEFSPNTAVDRECFTGSFNILPVLAEIALTHRCNLHCRFCYNACGRGHSRSGSSYTLTFKEIKRIIRILFVDAHVPSVSFTGGEPVLHPDLPRAIESAKSLGMRVNLITNGSLIDRETAERLRSHGLDSAQVSLEGTEAKIHEAITGARGSFAATVAAVGHLLGSGITTHTHTTINRINRDNCSLFPVFVKQTFGLERFSMNMMIPAGSGALNRDCLISYRDIGKSLIRIQENAQKNNVDFMWYSPVPMCLFNSIAHGLGNKGCSACDGLISIDANGDVLPCSSLPDPVGNLLKQDFQAVWKSAKARQYRQKAFSHEGCRECGEFFLCDGACPIYWDQQGYSELLPVLGKKNLPVGKGATDA